MSNQGKNTTQIYFYGLLIINMALWGGSWPLARWMVSDNFGLTVPPLIIATLRYFLVSLGFLAILWVKEKTLSWNIIRQHWIIFSVMGFFSVTLYQIAFLYGEYFTAASDASLIVATSPIWVLTIAFFTLKEPVTVQKIIGTILGFLGIFLIVGFSPNINVADRLLGDFFILIAALAYAIYTVLLRKFFLYYHDQPTEKPSSLFAITWISVIGFLFLIPIAVLLQPEYLSLSLYFIIPERIWLGIFYLAFLSTIVAYLIYTESISRLGASKSAVFVNFVPIFGIALSAIFLQEIIDPLVHFAALILIIIGVILVNHQVHKPSFPPGNSLNKHK